MSLDIHHNKTAQQFFSIIDGRMATLDYKFAKDKKTLDYYSTFVPEELRGKKIGEEIVKFAMDYAKNNHYKIMPSCPFVKRFIERHPDYQSLI